VTVSSNLSVGRCAFVSNCRGREQRSSASVDLSEWYCDDVSARIQCCFPGLCAAISTHSISILTVNCGRHLTLLTSDHLCRLCRMDWSMSVAKVASTSGNICLPSNNHSPHPSDCFSLSPSGLSPTCQNLPTLSNNATLPVSSLALLTLSNANVPVPAVQYLRTNGGFTLHKLPFTRARAHTHTTIDLVNTVDY